MPLSFEGSETTFYFSPACAGYGLNYAIDGKSIRFGFPDRSGSRSVCLPGIPVEVPQVLDLIRHTSQIDHRPNLTVSLKGGRHEFVFAPTGSTIAREIDGLEGQWRIHQVDGRTMEPNDADMITGTQYSLRWSNECLQKSRNFAIVGNQFAAFPNSSDPDFIPTPPPPPQMAGSPRIQPSVSVETEGHFKPCSDKPSSSVVEAFELIDVAIEIAKVGKHDVELRNNEGNVLTLKRADFLESLAGKWRVLELAGRKQSSADDIMLTITRSKISFEPKCAGFEWSYTYADNALITRRPDKVKPGPQFETPACFPGVGLSKARLAKALDGVTRADLVSAERIILSGAENILITKVK